MSKSHKTLDIYISTYKFNLEIIYAYTNMSKKHRQPIGDKLVQLGIDATHKIYLASKTKIPEDRLVMLRDLDLTIETIELFVRLLRDLHSINNDRYARMVFQIGDMKDQCVKWIKYTADVVNKRKQRDVQSS